VLRARDLGWNKKGNNSQTTTQTESTPKTIREYAVKVVRANDVMHKAAQQEVNILEKLAAADPEGKRHCIRLLDTFEYRNHVCMVFEAMDMNLREVVKKFGRGVGINLKAVQTYSFQLLQALKLMRKCGVLHADIKPDNILCNASHSSVKLCDLGSAMYVGNNELTPYLVSRFYRSPEVILGLPYEYAMDMWSLGCVIFELFTGKIAFPGKSNNGMLKLMMDLKGAFPKKMLKKGTFVENHFDNDVNMTFFLVETDPVTKQPIRTAINHPKVTRDLYKELEKKAGPTTDRKKLLQLADFLQQMLMLDPEKRVTVDKALSHPFIKGKSS
jgi:serine/threonine-protein kinase PRP4